MGPGRIRKQDSGVFQPLTASLNRKLPHPLLGGAAVFSDKEINERGG